MGVQIRQLRDMLRNRENEFERIHVHYRSLVDLGEANDHELESSFARPETLRNSRCVPCVLTRG